MRGTDGPFINSFAHGHASISSSTTPTPSDRGSPRSPSDVVETFVRLVLRAELDAIELHDLIDEVKRRDQPRRQADQGRDQGGRARARRAAQGGDQAAPARRAQRPAAGAAQDARRLLRSRRRWRGSTTSSEQRRWSSRSAATWTGYVVKPRWKPVPNTHAFSSEDGGEEADAPEQWTIGKLDEYGLTEEIERLVTTSTTEVARWRPRAAGQGLHAARRQSPPHSGGDRHPADRARRRRHPRTRQQVRARARHSVQGVPDDRGTDAAPGGLHRLRRPSRSNGSS